MCCERASRSLFADLLKCPLQGRVGYTFHNANEEWKVRLQGKFSCDEK